MITKKTFFIILFFGIMSGFSIMISGNTLNFWLSKEKVDIKTIGIFAIISLPYAINFIWTPIFDIKKIPILYCILGQRLSWVLCMQVLLALTVYIMSRLNPYYDLIWVAIYGFLISLFASAQDTILGALRTEIVSKNHQGEIAGMYILGYRIGMLLSGSIAIYISQYISWNKVYQLFAITIAFFPFILILLIGDFNTRINKDTVAFKEEDHNFTISLVNLIIKILKPIGNLKYVSLVLTFLILYRLPDNFIATMINPFLIHIGYNEFEISTAGKLFGILSAIIGGFVASYIMKRKSIFDSLLIFGVIHAVSHILFIVQEFYGKNIYLLFIITGFESVSGGMCMAAYIAYIASLCSGRFRATQYSFFSSMMGLSRSILPTISGYIAVSWGWSVFYLFTTLATIPSLIMIIYLRNISVKVRKT